VDKEIDVIKQPLPASYMLKTPAYKKVWKRVELRTSPAPMVLLGHSRLVTNGLQGISSNNQPISKDDIVVIHNGIIVNDAELWQRHPEMRRQWGVDTEILASLTRRRLNEGKGVIAAIQGVYSEIEGAATIAMLFTDVPILVLATNTGSLYMIEDSDCGICLFASEAHFLKVLIEKTWLHDIFDEASIKQIAAGRAYTLDVDTGKGQHFALAAEPSEQRRPNDGRVVYRVHDHGLDDEYRRDALRRCTRCILPETFPGITFDAEGVCSVCRDYRPRQLYGSDLLHQLADEHRSRDGSHDCVVAFSGGRDSSYMLHYVVQELGLHPVAYSYDWGMVTDLARRNQARLTGKLGVEHILVSADIKRKRRNIQRNVQAWLKRPSLGMIPLFMAGDKQYFYYLNKVRNQFNVQLAFLGGNPLEKTGFKTAFAGVHERPGARTYDISPWRKMQMIGYYLNQFIRNPAYLNQSLVDTAHAFYSSYLMKHDFSWLFHYIPWDEEVIEKTLKAEYDWETARDTDTTWRIGDGTTAFYNYIYYVVTGFSEIDTFRSNQIREGLISREEAIKLAAKDNQPRYESMREYAYQIGIDMDEAMFVINAMPKLY
jgi:hypothetical protein